MKNVLVRVLLYISVSKTDKFNIYLNVLSSNVPNVDKNLFFEHISLIAIL